MAKKGGKGGGKDGKKEVKNKVASPKYKAYKIEGDKATLAYKQCPKCGPGVFMANHKDRKTCGKCGYTEFN